ncbi:hypothetical protein [Streptomyces mooreae]|uniref:hypothetical protein n=1 Tax=Streptomyces mooreae TaxID=3075523 RepID=UPI00288B9A3F|nr:hypothetical protein [Streptomyces sp. DSM 41527]
MISRPWADCDRCAGSGWAGEDDALTVFCRYCDGSGLQEHTAASVGPEGVSDNAKARCAAYIDALRIRIASDRVAVPA